MEEGLSFVDLASRISWPNIDGGKIPTQEFLDSCQLILTFFDTLGKVYTPVRQDVEGNIKKLGVKYSENPSQYKYIHDMITLEVENNEDFASISLLWLKRGLHFVCLFLQSLVVDHERNVKEENILENIRTSYDITLRPHHNWMLQKLFMMLSRAAPSRRDLFKSMTKNSGDMDQDEIICRVKGFVEGLRINLISIFDLYVNLKLDTYQFVPLPA